ncbi:uncharacterized protein LOC106137776 [Amyelois transitella]|uniref:uncharacterized protein LOC106137776 n=1 Tax=Amyelois transitella TaxID=680683 RepID=UPI00067C731C|nr:uncharacterized protein LOC106137776 [Amyelois transitella]XP_060808661.1 uncharacterized protein LOC106137776 [Amyelois transitella]
MAGLKTLIFFALGVALLGVASCGADQSETAITGDDPIGSPDSNIDKRQIETPEVVLQLKYNGGELNRIYLAQFRKGAKQWVPSVPARTNLCADLCHAGLGGEGCGATCKDLVPVGLKSALSSANETHSAYGQPRYAVCPTLCQNKLGDPLCHCAALMGGAENNGTIDWSAICSAFCISDLYVLGGCPVCDQVSASPRQALTRTLDTAEGWAAWCDVQCRQGQGGAACNCDRAPFQ